MVAKGECVMAARTGYQSSVGRSTNPWDQQEEQNSSAATPTPGASSWETGMGPPPTTAASSGEIPSGRVVTDVYNPSTSATPAQLFSSEPIESRFTANPTYVLPAPVVDPVAAYGTTIAAQNQDWGSRYGGDYAASVGALDATTAQREHMQRVAAGL